MACGACAKNKARRKATLERRRAAQKRKEEEKLAKAAAAQANKLQKPAPVVEPTPEPSAE